MPEVLGRLPLMRRYLEGLHSSGGGPPHKEHHAPPLQPVILFRSAPPIAPTPVSGCTVHLDLGAASVAFSGVASAHGAVSLSVLTPNDPGLIGLAEHWQAQVISGGASYYSNGLELKKGS